MALRTFLATYKWAILLIIALGFLFYWYEVRPIRIYRGCAVQSSVDARKLLRSKSELMKGTKQGDSYKKLVDKDMYLRSDYESFFKKCVNYYGLEKPVQDGTSSSSSSSKAAGTSSSAK
jgi:hypothetical protein